MQSARGWARAIPRRQQAELADRYIKALDIRPTDPEAIVANLSGGNQQKVLLARWLLTAPKLLLLDEPTRGIDVGAKAEIQRLVAALADDGISVLFISAELDEVLRLSHRIVVMRELHKVAEIDNRGTTVSDLMQHHRRGRRDRGRCGDGAVKAIVVASPVLAAGHPRRPARRHAAEVADLLRHQHSSGQPVYGTADHDPASHGADAARRAGHDARHRDPRHRPVGGRRGGDRRAPPRRRSSTRRRIPMRSSPCSSASASACCWPPLGGVWNGFLVTVLGIQPIVATLVLMTAGRGVAQLITDERIITASSRPYEMIGGGYWLGLPFSIDPRRRHRPAHRPAHPPHRARGAARVGRRQPGGVTPRRRAGPLDHLDGVHRVRRVRRDRRA